jgi:hypothetical protein
MAKGDSGFGRLRLDRIVARLDGARMCFGEPVHVGDRAVIPVARVRARGGMGAGANGGGGGGVVQASPMGFVELGPDGARFTRVRDVAEALRIVGTGVAAAGAVAAGVAGVRGLRGSRRPARALPAVLRNPRRLVGR